MSWRERFFKFSDALRSYFRERCKLIGCGAELYHNDAEKTFVHESLFCITQSCYSKACLEAGAKIDIDVFQQTRV
jgi:hypothetical protein